MKNTALIFSLFLFCFASLSLPVEAKITVNDVKGKPFKHGLVSKRKGTETSIAVTASGKIYAAYQDNGNQAKVKVFEAGRWNDVADAVHPGGVLSAGKGGNPSLATSGEQLFVAFMDYANNTRAKVMQWNGSQWIDLADANHPGGYISTQIGYEPTLAVDRSGTYLYVAFTDQASGDRMKVLRWNASLGWSEVSGTGNPGGLISPSSAFEATIVASKTDDRMYVAFEDTANGNRIRTMTWNGQSWVNLSDAAHPDGLVSLYDAYSPALAVDYNEQLYLVYTSKNTTKLNAPIGNLKRKEAPTFIHKWDGSSWSTIGNGLVTNTKSIESTIAVDQRNHLYVAFSEHKKNVKIEGKRRTFWRVKVKVWNGTQWITKSKKDPYISKGSGKGDPSLVTYNNSLYIIFTDPANKNRARVKHFIYN